MFKSKSKTSMKSSKPFQKLSQMQPTSSYMSPIIMLKIIFYEINFLAGVHSFSSRMVLLTVTGPGSAHFLWIRLPSRLFAKNMSSLNCRSFCPSVFIRHFLSQQNTEHIKQGYGSSTRREKIKLLLFFFFIFDSNFLFLFFLFSLDNSILFMLKKNQSSSNKLFI